MGGAYAVDCNVWDAVCTCTLLACRDRLVLVSRLLRRSFLYHDAIARATPLRLQGHMSRQRKTLDRL